MELPVEEEQGRESCAEGVSSQTALDEQGSEVDAEDHSPAALFELRGIPATTSDEFERSPLGASPPPSPARSRPGIETLPDFLDARVDELERQNRRYVVRDRWLAGQVWLLRQLLGEQALRLEVVQLYGTTTMQMLRRSHRGGLRARQVIQQLRAAVELGRQEQAQTLQNGEQAIRHMDEALQRKQREADTVRREMEEIEEKWDGQKQRLIAQRDDALERLQRSEEASSAAIAALRQQVAQLKAEKSTAAAPLQSSASTQTEAAPDLEPIASAAATAPLPLPVQESPPTSLVASSHRSADEVRAIGSDVRAATRHRPRTINLLLATESSTSSPDVHLQPCFHSTRWVPAESLPPALRNALLHALCRRQWCRLCCGRTAAYSIFHLCMAAAPSMTSDVFLRLYRFANAFEPVRGVHFLCGFLADLHLRDPPPGAPPGALPYFDCELPTTLCQAVGGCVDGWEQPKVGPFPAVQCARCNPDGKERTYSTCAGHWKAQHLHVHSGVAACCEEALKQLELSFSRDSKLKDEWMRRFEAAIPLKGRDCRHSAVGRRDLPAVGEEDGIAEEVNNVLVTAAEHRTRMERYCVKQLGLHSFPDSKEDEEYEEAEIDLEMKESRWSIEDADEEGDAVAPTKKEMKQRPWSIEDDDEEEEEEEKEDEAEWDSFHATAPPAEEAKAPLGVEADSDDQPRPLKRRKTQHADSRTRSRKSSAAPRRQTRPSRAAPRRTTRAEVGAGPAGSAGVRSRPSTRLSNLEAGIKVADIYPLPDLFSPIRGRHSRSTSEPLWEHDWEDDEAAGDLPPPPVEGKESAPQAPPSLPLPLLAKALAQRTRQLTKAGGARGQRGQPQSAEPLQPVHQRTHSEPLASPVATRPLRVTKAPLFSTLHSSAALHYSVKPGASPVAVEEGIRQPNAVLAAAATPAPAPLPLPASSPAVSRLQPPPGSSPLPPRPALAPLSSQQVAQQANVRPAASAQLSAYAAALEHASTTERKRKARTPNKTAINSRMKQESRKQTRLRA